MRLGTTITLAVLLFCIFTAALIQFLVMGKG